MLRSVRAYIRQHHVGLIAIFLILGGGTAYAVDGPNPGQNTIGSEDIIGNEVKSDDIGNGRIFNLDIADDIITGAKIKDRTLTQNDLGLDSVAGAELAEVDHLGERVQTLNDPSGGAPAEAILFDDAAGADYIARCNVNGSNTTASIVVKSDGAAKTLAVDSTAPNGANSAVNVPHGTETTLVSAGPTPTASFAVGDYSVIGFDDADSLNVAGPSGIVAVSTNFGLPDCRFKMTVLR